MCLSTLIYGLFVLNQRSKVRSRRFRPPWDCPSLLETTCHQWCEVVAVWRLWMGTRIKHLTNSNDLLASNSCPGHQLLPASLFRRSDCNFLQSRTCRLRCVASNMLFVNSSTFVFYPEALPILYSPIEVKHIPGVTLKWLSVGNSHLLVQYIGKSVAVIVVRQYL